MFKNGGLLLQKKVSVPANVDKDSIILFLDSNKKLCYVNDQGYVHIIDDNKDTPTYVDNTSLNVDVPDEMLISTNTFFGDGSDGDVVLASSITLDRDYFYKNLTLNAGGEINTNGFRIYVQDSITFNGGIIKNNGNNATSTNSTFIGSNGAIETKVGTLGQGSAGSKSVNASILDGQNTGATPTLPVANGGKGGFGGNGGDGKVGKGGKSTQSSNPNKHINRNVYLAIMGTRGIHLIGGGLGGDAGAAGGGDGKNCGAAGGGGGGGGGVLQLIAKNIKITPYAQYPSIMANGGNGANGNDATLGDCGGGGGGSGGGGGFIQIFYLNMASQSDNFIQAKGGNRGIGGKGCGEGKTGYFGGSGYDGTIECANVKTGNWSIFVGSSNEKGYK